MNPDLPETRTACCVAGRTMPLLALIATLAACGEDQPAPYQPVAHPVGPPGASAPPRPAAPIVRQRQERGFDMLRRELAYLGSLPAKDTHRIEVGARQVLRTVGWLELRKVPVPPAVTAIRPRLDEALADSPGEPPAPPVEPTLDPAAEVGGIFDQRGAYMGRYEGAEGTGSIISTTKGPVVILLSSYPDSVGYGDAVRSCGVLLDYQEAVDIRGKWVTARFYQRAEYDECKRAAKERKATRAARKVAFKEAQKQHKLALAEYEKQLGAYAYRKANFDQLKTAALAGLPQLAQGAVAGLGR